jgi:hypothetical protein
MLPTLYNFKILMFSPLKISRHETKRPVNFRRRKENSGPAGNAGGVAGSGGGDASGEAGAVDVRVVEQHHVARRALVHRG